MSIDFNGDKVETAAKVCSRFEQMLGSGPANGFGSRKSRLMDLLAADGKNGNQPLDFDALLVADDFNFLHDVGGIHRHMDRTTGTIGDCFVPRFARVAE